MALIARCKFTAPSTSDGISLIGAAGVVVTVANGDNTGVDQWQFVVVDRPAGSALALGVAQAWSATATWSFTPDAGLAGSYFIEVWVKNVTTGEIRVSSVIYKDQVGSGAGGVYAVLGNAGIPYIPLGALGRHLNFSSDTRGWAKQMQQWFDYLDKLQLKHTVQTTDATVTTLATIALKDEYATKIDCVVVARKSADDEAATFNLSMSYVRTAAGAPVALGAVTSSDPRSTAGAAAWVATIDVSGNNARIRVTGAAATTINWESHTQIVEVT